MKKLLPLLLIAIITCGPLAVYAQTSCANGTIVPTGTRCPDTDATTDVLGRFNPGITSMSGGGNSFDGMNFSGVGGAVLGCTNIGESITGGVSDLFKKAKNAAQNDSPIPSNPSSNPGPVTPDINPGVDTTSGEVNPQTNNPVKNIKTGDSTSTIGGGSGQPVVDTTANIQLTKVAAELKKQSQRENCLNGVAYAVAKNLLQQVSNKTLTWINTGLGGNPFYVRDIDSYLTNIQNDKISTFLDTIPTTDPVFGNALRSVITQQVTGKSDGFLTKTMDTPEARIYENFQNDFTQGGWSALLNPNNNAIGAFFKATNRLSGEINTAQQNTKDELQQGQGFLSMKTCVEYRKTTTDSSASSTPYDSSSDSPRSSNPSNNPGPVTPGITAGVDTTTSSPQYKCIRYETTTPGSVIAAQANTISTSPVRQLEAADSINEVLGSFFDQLLNRLFSTGLGGLSGAGIASGNNTIRDSRGNLIQSINQGTSENAFGYQTASGGFNGEFDISRPQQLRAIIKTQQNFINKTKDVRLVMDRIIPTLGKLDYCVPGPNPTWKVGTNYNAELFLSALAGKAPSQTVGNTISALSSVASGIPGPGTVIALVGTAVGSLINVFGGKTPVSVSASSLELFDKVTNTGREMSDFKLNRKRFFDDIPLVDYLSTAYDSLVGDYEKIYDQKIIRAAFETANPGNPLNQGRVSDIIDETNNLVYYNQSINEFDRQNVANLTETEEAVAKLNAIRDEVESIVDTAKKRYIKEQARKGIALNKNKVTGKLCIDEAYNVQFPTKAILGDTRSELKQTDAAQKMIDQSNAAGIYFYNHL